MTVDIPTQLTPPVHEGDHVRGAADAPVTLVEYADYQCPYCGEAFYALRALEQRMGDRLRFAFRNFPLTRAHPFALQAAEAAEAAGAQGRFWEMHDILFQHQDALDLHFLLRYAEQLDLDLERFRRDLEEHRFVPRIEQDMESGVRSGVQGTPSFFINRQRYEGEWDFDTLLSVLQHVAR